MGGWLDTGMKNGAGQMEHGEKKIHDKTGNSHTLGEKSKIFSWVSKHLATKLIWYLFGNQDLCKIRNRYQTFHRIITK